MLQLKIILGVPKSQSKQNQQTKVINHTCDIQEFVPRNKRHYRLQLYHGTLTCRKVINVKH